MCILPKHARIFCDGFTRVLYAFIIIFLAFLLTPVQLHAQDSDPTLVKAFAFGATNFTRFIPNAPLQRYTKVVQDGANFLYSTNQGHGYSDIDDIDNTLNDRDVYGGNDQIYDEFIGCMNAGEIVFRIDLPNGHYRFVAAGGDASFSNHRTTVRVRDGSNGTEATLVSRFEPAQPGIFFTVGFEDKSPPSGDRLGPQPSFLPRADSPEIEITKGYLEVIQIADDLDRGGDLCLLEVWQIQAANRPPQVVNAIDDFSLEVDGGSWQQNLTEVFSDPDGDDLTFSLKNSASNKIETTLSGNVLTAMALAEGTANITVIATDPDDASVEEKFVVTALPANPVLLQANFTNGTNGFTFVPDAFHSTSQSAYANGARVGNAGHDGWALRVLLGGRNGQAINDMSGGWRAQFLLGSAKDVTLSYYFQLIQAENYESDEFSEALVTVDGRYYGLRGEDYVARIVGDGNLGVDQTVGWQRLVLHLGQLAAGNHTLTIGCFNNRKTTADEETEIFIDDVLVTTENINGPPVLFTPIPDTTIALSNAEFQFDLSAFFVDPEGQSISFDARSLDRRIIRVSASDDILSILPIREGVGRVSVTAGDNAGESIFQVTVVETNVAPVITRTLPDTSIFIDDGEIAFDLNNLFSDPDGDKLDFDTESSKSKVARAEISGDILTVTPLSLGKSKITITASDDIHDEVEQSFDLTVLQRNRAPVLSNPIPDQSLLVDDTDFELNLENHFEDPDGDDLKYAVENTNGGVVLAELRGSNLTLTPVSVGTADLTIQASDPDGLAVTDAFRVIIERGNRSPVVTQNFSDLLLIEDDPAVTFELNDFFADPDGDALAFSAVLSNNTIATLEIVDSKLTVVPVLVGSTEVTVRAADSGGLEVEDHFQIEIEARNLPPVIMGEIPDTTLVLGDPDTEKDLARVYSDPEGDVLTYFAFAENADIVDVSVSGSALRLSGREQGQTTVTVSANDARNEDVSFSFEVRVSQNRPPVLINPIPPNRLRLGEPNLVLDLNTVFEDPEDDPMTFTAMSSNASVAAVSLSGSRLTVVQLAPGDVTLHVTAADNDNFPVSHIFPLTVERANRRPTLSHGIPDTLLFLGGQNFKYELSHVFVDADGDPLTFSAKSTNETVAVASTQSAMLSVIPLQLAQTAVKVYVDDGHGGKDSTVFSVTVFEYPSSISVNRELTFGEHASAREFNSREYRIWGMPGADRRLISQLFQGVQNQSWQVFWDNGKSKDYFVSFDGSESFRLDTGQAFWVINNGNWRVSSAAKSAPLNVANEAEIVLHPGFNLITNPFMNSVSWASVQAINQVSEPLWKFDGSFVQSAILEAFEGYYFFNREELSALRIPFSLTLSEGQAAAGINDYLWAGEISIRVGEKELSSATFGQALGAAAGPDRRDHVRPHTFADETALYFERPEWQMEFRRFVSDIRPPADEVSCWPFEVVAGKQENITLVISSLPGLPADLDVRLVNLASGRVQRINSQAGNIYHLESRSEISKFEIFVGSPDAVSDELIDVVPTDFVVERNYPNPFNPVTSIPVSVPRAINVSVAIYNILGQEVTVLHNGLLSAGRHILEWQGRDARGQEVGSGVYFYRVVARGDQRFEGKMLLLR